MNARRLVTLVRRWRRASAPQDPDLIQKRFILAIQSKLRELILIEKREQSLDLAQEIYAKILSDFEVLGFSVIDTANLRFPLVLEKVFTPQSKIQLFLQGSDIELDMGRLSFSFSNREVPL